jgi:hypothetical protein
MIPPLLENGYLPPGLHPATLDEIAHRFGQESELRRVQMESIRWALELAERAGIQRFVVNGSFVTDIPEPNDVDCVLLVCDDPPMDAALEEELVAGLPFLELQLVDQVGFDVLVTSYFATDWLGAAKGMVEIVK